MKRSTTVSRRRFLKGSGLAGLGLMLRHSPLSAAEALAEEPEPYRRFEDVYRNKWTWDRVARGTHGTNCAGTCAFNVYIKGGVVWREEQQAEYEPSGDDVPDYGPRGCQKGLRHSNWMYGKQRVLYPMKRAGERGEGKWQRITWEQATDEIADRIIDYSLEYGPDSISFGSGTMMSVKLASFSSLARFANIAGFTVPEFYSGVGDLPTGVYMTIGTAYTGDTMAAIYKSRCVLVWMANPAVTRLPDAHFFWEARYNGTQVISISPEFTPTAMHSSLWVNPKPGTDTALAMGMIHTILEDGTYERDYLCEQTDLPFLVRADTGEFLRETDLSFVATLAVRDNVFYIWDEATGQPRRAPATGLSDKPIGRDRRRFETLELGDLRPALEGTWQVETRGGTVEVTTVFELLKRKAAEHSPERAAEITGVHPKVIRKVARTFAAARPAMIYTGYSACKWIHGDLLQRAMLLLVALTGSTGKEGGGLQIANAPKTRGMMAFAFADVGPAFRMVSSTTWDYEHGRMKELTEKVYGKELAEDWDARYQESIREDYFPSYGDKGWKMGIFAGNNGANWRASGNRWREVGFGKLETIVAMVPDMGCTAHYADYVLPIAHHYERTDMMLQSRVPYVQVLDAAVLPLGESVDDWTAMNRLAEAISRRARERGIGAIRDDVDGRTVRRDFRSYHDLYTMDGSIESARDVVQYLINVTPGVPKMSFEELAAKGIVRVDDSDGTTWDGEHSPYHNEVARSVVGKRPYETLTGRQQYYIDHEWFLEYGEALPTHLEPLAIEGFPIRFVMGHARHGIHSMWRDDPLMLALQRGEPDIYLNPDDAAARGIADGDPVRVFNPAGAFVAMAHVSAGIQPSMVFMYHGWDPMMFEGRENFSAVISTAGLIKPTSMAGDYGHLGHRVLQFAPNQTYRDFTCELEKWDGNGLA
ncbi:MAG: molybdopterin-dependent oxidoreductase [bacterium]|nr:molybdopterin-dependent oxidoreductase [bacterium]